MKHTPGEWRTEAVSDAVRVVVGTGRQKVILARLCPPQLSEDETWANARLMSAAPNLLKTLEWLDRIGGLGLNVHERISAAIKSAQVTS